MKKKMRIQDVYAIGMKLHSLLIARRIHLSRTQRDHQERWEDGIREMRTLLATKNFGLIGGDFEIFLNEIDWGYSTEEHHHGA